MKLNLTVFLRLVPPDQPTVYEDTMLIAAVWSGSSRLLASLLRADAPGRRGWLSSVDAVNDDGETALWWAVYLGNIKHVKMLLLSGADIDKV